MKTRTYQMFRWALFIGCMLLYQLSVTQPRLGYEGAGTLRWHPAPNCIAVPNEKTAPYDLARIVIENSQKEVVRTVCESEAFTPHGDWLDLSYGGVFPKGSQARLKLSLIDTNGKEIAKATAKSSEGNGWFRRLRVDVSRVPADTQLHVRISARGADFANFYARSRVDYFRAGPLDSIVRAVHREGLQWPICFVAGFALLAQLFWLLKKENLSRREVAAFFFVASVAAQFRLNATFHADEWHFLWRIHEKGLSAILLTHNEHFIPVFSFFYYLQYKLFGLHYSGFMLVSCLLVAVNGWLLAKFVRVLAAEQLPSGTEWFAGLFYVVSALHIDSVQWALSQSCILAVTFTLLSLLSLCKFLQNNETRFAFAIGASLIGAVFSFAIGFLLFLLLPLMAVFLYARNGQAFNRRSLLVLSTALLVSLSVTALCYRTFREGYKHEQANDLSVATWDEINDFTALGSQFGTVLRGSGIFPYADMNRFYPLLRDASAVSVKHFRERLAEAGEVTSLLLLFFYLYTPSARERKWRAGIWALGQAWIIAPLLFVAFGRAHIGDDYSISFRYHEYPLVGLAMMLLPLFCVLWEVSRHHRSALVRQSVTMFLGLFLIAQFHIGTSTELLSQTGASMHEFLDEVLAWSAGDTPESKDRPLVYSPFFKAMVDHELPIEQIVELAK